MKKAKEKENKTLDKKLKKQLKMNNSVHSEDENVIKKFIIISLSILILAGLAYFITEKTKKNDDDSKETEKIAGEVNYDVVSIGTMLNRPYEEYYVMLYDSSNSSASLFSYAKSNYENSTTKKDKLKIYYCDLGNSLNKKYYNDSENFQGNKNAKSINEFMFGELTLLKIKNGKVEKYIEGIEEVNAELK